MTRKPITELSGSASGKPGHSLKVISVKFDKDDPNLLISGGWDHTIQIWDVREGQPVRSIYGPKICGDAIDINDGYILTGSCRPEEQLQVWSLADGQLMFSLAWNGAGGDLVSPDPCLVYTC